MGSSCDGRPLKFDQPFIAHIGLSNFWERLSRVLPIPNKLCKGFRRKFQQKVPILKVSLFLNELIGSILQLLRDFIIIIKITYVCQRSLWIAPYVLVLAMKIGHILKSDKTFIPLTYRLCMVKICRFRVLSHPVCAVFFDQEFAHGNIVTTSLLLTLQEPLESFPEVQICPPMTLLKYVRHS